MHEQPDLIDAALRRPEPRLADDEFSANVLARLPARRRRSAARQWTLAGAAGLGSALTLVLAPPLESVVSALSPVPVPPLAVTTVAALAIVIVPALFVFYSARSDH